MQRIGKLSVNGQTVNILGLAVTYTVVSVSYSFLYTTFTNVETILSSRAIRQAKMGDSLLTPALYYSN